MYLTLFCVFNEVNREWPILHGHVILFIITAATRYVLLIYAGSLQEIVQVVIFPWRIGGLRGARTAIVGRYARFSFSNRIEADIEFESKSGRQEPSVEELEKKVA